MLSVKVAEVRKQLDEYLRKDWIKHSTTPYGAHILYDRKIDGTLRMCIDYRALNQQMQPDKYLLAMIDDQLDWIVNLY